ncbi:MAG: hypothetical protein JO329_11190, partial [Planctomycetaceae bacterium]|nr:hypothetical protein [Planctomycetaceae bacterium]
MSSLKVLDEGGLPVLPIVSADADAAAVAPSPAPPAPAAPPRRRLPEWLKRPIPEA